jgi:hypothetical protein
MEKLTTVSTAQPAGPVLGFAHESWEEYADASLTHDDHHPAAA